MNSLLSPACLTSKDGPEYGSCDQSPYLTRLTPSTIKAIMVIIMVIIMVVIMDILMVHY